MKAGIFVLSLGSVVLVGCAAPAAPHSEVVPNWINLTEGDQARCQEALSMGRGGCAVFTEAELRVLLFQMYQKGRKEGAEKAS